MGDFPRWVHSEDVDSSAMFSAYLSYDLKMKEWHFGDEASWHPVWHGHLFMINHRVRHVEGVVRVEPHGVPGRDCQQRPCRRCETLAGGYQLRWYSRYGAKFYSERRRPRSWGAPEPQAEPTASSSLRFSRGPEAE